MGTRNRCRVVLAMAAALAVSACTLTPARDATSTAQRYADALNAKDVETMIALTDPEVLKRTENGEELRRLYPQIFGALDIHEAIHGISPGFSDSTGMHYFVTTTRDSRQPNGSGMRIDNYYIVTSRDLGKTWTIVDLSCVDERWIKGIAPGWNGYPPIPPQSVRQYSVTSKLLRVPSE